MTATLKKAFERASELPEGDQEAFAKFLLEELELLAAIQEGIDAADRGETISPHDARKLIPTWISESKSRNLP